MWPFTDEVQATRTNKGLTKPKTKKLEVHTDNTDDGESLN